MTFHKKTQVCNFCNEKFNVSTKTKGFCSPVCRFFSKINFGHIDKCWPFMGATDITGYGKFSENYTEYKAHRYSWEIFKGKIPIDKFILHKCDNPPCINPTHLFLGNPFVNVRDMIDKGRRKSDKGILNPNAKLNESDVFLIRKLLSEKTFTLENIGKLFKVSPITIFDIKHNKTWTHI